MSRVAFILPGYLSSTDEENYQRVAEIYRQSSFQVEKLDIEWEKDFWNNCNKVKNLIEKRREEYDSPETHFFGHSWGSAVLLTISPNFNPKTQVLASLSPDFKEDDEHYFYLWKKLAPVFQILLSPFYDIPEELDERPSLEEKGDKIESDLYLIYGEREYNGFMDISSLGMGGKITENRRQILDCEEIIVKGATHSMTSDHYIEQIEEIVAKL
ncbi:MAG: hypothetical protein ABEJ56_05420 [Candidatus Nanohaloarchaea archaeon]